jgi:hypothetical protein
MIPPKGECFKKQLVLFRWVCRYKNTFTADRAFRTTRDIVVLVAARWLRHFVRTLEQLDFWIKPGAKCSEAKI